MEEIEVFMVQSRLLFALTLLSLGAACDLKPKASNGQIPAPPAASPAAAQTAGPLSGVAIMLDAPTVTALSEDHWAQIEGDPDWTYEWSLEGGRLTTGITANPIRFVAGDTGRVLVRCRVRDASGREGTAFKEQMVVAPPVLSLFEALPPLLTQGEMATLRWEARDATKLTLDPDAHDLFRMRDWKVQPVQTVTYTVTAANPAGAEVRKSLTLKVVPPPVIRSFGAEGSSKANQPLNLRAEFADGKAEIRQGSLVVAASSESPLRLQVTPASTTVYTLVVTNEAGASSTQTLTVSIQPPPK